MNLSVKGVSNTSPREKNKKKEREKQVKASLSERLEHRAGKQLETKEQAPIVQLIGNTVTLRLS